MDGEQNLQQEGFGNENPPNQPDTSSAEAKIVDDVNTQPTENTPKSNPMGGGDLYQFQQSQQSSPQSQANTRGNQVTSQQSQVPRGYSAQANYNQPQPQIDPIAAVAYVANQNQVS